MTTIFIAGSRSIRALHPSICDRIGTIVRSGFHVVVGDAPGADALVQAHLVQLGYPQVAVYCSGDSPRVNLGAWPVRRIAAAARPGTRAFQAAKDLAMAEAADYGLMVWDSESLGTLGNILSLLERRKTCVAYLQEANEHLTIGDVQKLETLVQRMPEDAKKKADRAVDLIDRVEALRRMQYTLAIDPKSEL